jgi:hypothetical protein
LTGRPINPRSYPAALAAARAWRERLCTPLPYSIRAKAAVRLQEISQILETKGKCR